MTRMTSQKEHTAGISIVALLAFGVSYAYWCKANYLTCQVKLYSQKIRTIHKMKKAMIKVRIPTTQVTRMHSSRMHTAHFWTILCSIPWGVCPTPQEADALWRQTCPKQSFPGGRPPCLDADLLVMWPVMHAGKPTPPCEQNYRQM